MELSRGRSGLRAMTKVPFGTERRELRIETSKHFNGGVSSSAVVVQWSEDGQSYRHAFGLAAEGDYHKTLVYDPQARATEKTIRALHDKALASLDTVMAEVGAKYNKAA